MMRLQAKNVAAISNTSHISTKYSTAIARFRWRSQILKNKGSTDRIGRAIVLTDSSERSTERTAKAIVFDAVKTIALTIRSLDRPAFLGLGIFIFLSWSVHSIAAPPNPHLFFDYNAVTSEWAVKPGKDASAFVSILQDCCQARAASILQTDGIEYVIAIKIDFDDQRGRRPGRDFDQFLFADEGVSLKTYYQEVSYGQMDIQSGPMGGVVPKGNQWVRAARPMGYYGQGRINHSRSLQLVREACAGVDEIVDFSQYDRDNDGVVDHVFVIHAGDDEASTFTGVVGPNIWSILAKGVNRRFDGVLVDTAVLVAEEPSFEKPHLGIYFHEFFHDFGAPDVYNPGITGPHDHKWGLMSLYGPYQGSMIDGVGDGLRPSHIMGYLKWDFDARPENGRTGWIQPVEISKNVNNLQIPSFELPPHQDKLFRVDISSSVETSGNRAEFFLIENRYQESGATFDTHLPESGILIWHIDETQTRPLGSVNAAQQIWLEDPNDPEHIGVDPKNPDALSDIRLITDGAAYSANDNQTTFTPTTHPNTNSNDGAFSGIFITNIGFEGQTMSISVSFGDTYEPNDTLTDAFPIELLQTYESFLFDADDPRDLYQFDVAEGQAVVITLTNIPEGVDYRLSLLDAKGAAVAEAEKMEGTEQQIIYLPDRISTLYISIESRFGFSSTNSYRLTADAVRIESGTLKLMRRQFDDSIRVYPNPIPAGHADVIFAYTIPGFQLADEVELSIYTIAGDLIFTDSHQNVIGSKQFRWDGKNSQGNAIASGIYMYVVSATEAGESIQKIGKISHVR